ncbi:MAG: site-2 protease family protein [Candidatus Paceibacterota bacterium]
MIVIYFILTLFFISLILTIHELGHFLTSLLFGVKAEEFGLGYPPRILGIKIKDIVFSINLIPFGAITKIEEGNKDNPSSDSFWGKNFFEKIIILLSGSIFNILLAFLIFVVLFSIGFPKNVLPIEIFKGESLKYPFYTAVFKTIVFMKIVFEESMKSLVQSFGSLFLKGEVKNFVGPVGLVAITQQAFKLGFKEGFYLLGLISYVLGIFNLLPIPALDGGRIFLILIEKIKKKPISQKTENIINNISFSLLLILLVIVSIKDVRFFIFQK